MEQQKSVPFFAHENALAREERKERRMWITILALIGAVTVQGICQKFLSRRNKGN
jgi:hypothetical protein